MSRLDLVCAVDEFWQQFAPWWQRHLLACGARQRLRATRRQPSAIRTSAIRVQQSGYRTCKAFSTPHVQQPLRSEFAQLVSDTRFVELLPTVLAPRIVSLPPQLRTGTGRRSCIASTALAVGKNPRLGQHRVFALDAARGTTAVGWFSGCKLQLVGNDRGQLLAVCLPPGTGDDRRPLPRLVKRRFGTRFGDRGSSCQDLAADLLVTQGVRFITKRRKHLRNRLLDLGDKLLLRKRAVIESSVDELNNVCQTRACSSSQPAHLSREPESRAHCLLPSAQDAVATSRLAGPASGCLAYPELTLPSPVRKSPQERRAILQLWTRRSIT